MLLLTMVLPSCVTADEPRDPPLATLAAKHVGELGDPVMGGTTQKTPLPPVPAQDPSLTGFASTLDQLVSLNAELKRAVEEAMARSVRQALAFGDGPLPSTEDFLAALRTPTIAATGGTFMQGYWWGFQIKVSHGDLDVFLAIADPLNTISAALTAVLWPPAAPFIGLAAEFITSMLALLKELDHGNGVYISMSWFAPGVFVPATA
jgi:hypothetical protein